MFVTSQASEGPEVLPHGMQECRYLTPLQTEEVIVVKRTLLAVCVICVLLALLAQDSRSDDRKVTDIGRPAPRLIGSPASVAPQLSRSECETLWIFDADFEDLTGDNAGWLSYDHADPQTGVRFWRGQTGIDFDTGRTPTCDDRPAGSWMYAAVDPFTGHVVDGESAELASPAINVSGASNLVARWEIWVDCPRQAHDFYVLLDRASDDPLYVVEPIGAGYPKASWRGGPAWEVVETDLAHVMDLDWLGLHLFLWNEEDHEPGSARGGVFLNRVRVGAVSCAGETRWHCDREDLFKDWFDHELLPGEALDDQARVRVRDEDGVSDVHLFASNNGGASWNSYALTSDLADWWEASAPVDLMDPGKEIWYYYRALDPYGNESYYPGDPGGPYFEFSILPIIAEGPETVGILVVDKHGELTPDENGDYTYESEHYYREALDVLGFGTDYNVYDVRDPLGDATSSQGPDIEGLRNYETVIWFTNDLEENTVTLSDQITLETWLSDALNLGAERNLLLAGNRIGTDLSVFGADQTNFFDHYLYSVYNGEIHFVDWPLLVVDAWGDDTFLSNDCWLRRGCPRVNLYDCVLTDALGEYAQYVCGFPVNGRGGGVAYDNPVLHCQTVYLCFGLESIVGERISGGDFPIHENGFAHVVDLLENIMDYFEVEPSEFPTDVDHGQFRNRLSQSHPNPFNPIATIAYSVRDAEHVTIGVHDVAGKLVRTLLDADVDAGHSGSVVWDGRDAEGRQCASGVYFYRIDTPGFEASRKMVMLK